MSILLNGDCLEELKDLDDNSIDLIFCDLPYAVDNYSAVSCKWNTPIDLDKLWIEFMRIKKLNTPIVMTCTTKFGVSLINSAPKKCPFRYDLIWCKSAPAGFLCAKKMPMRKHEMVYVFYEKLPFYDLSSHKHKFIKEKNGTIDGNKVYEGKKVLYRNKCGLYDPALPTSLIKEVIVDKEEIDQKYKNKGGLYSKVSRNGLLKAEPHYEPPLPTSLIKEEIVDKVETKTVYKPSFTQKENADNLYQKCGRKNGESAYEPALPTSLLEIKSTRGKHSTEKPVQLMEWILKYYSKEGDTILDPTMGSGSMGVACKNMNRNFIGIEKDPEIYEGAINRVEN